MQKRLRTLFGSGFHVSVWFWIQCENEDRMIVLLVEGFFSRDAALCSVPHYALRIAGSWLSYAGVPISRKFGSKAEFLPWCSRYLGCPDPYDNPLQLWRYNRVWQRTKDPEIANGPCSRWLTVRFARSCPRLADFAETKALWWVLTPR